MKKVENMITKAIGVGYLVFFMPLLLMVCIGGNKVKYWDALKMQTLCPNFVLTIMAIGGCLLAMAAIKWGKRIKISIRMHYGLDVILAVFWVMVYFLNLYVVRQIAFKLANDISVVRGAAMQIAEGQAMGYQSYFSIYPNNIPIIYILGKTLKYATEHPYGQYDAEYIWLQIGCVLTSVAGFFVCMLVKQITENIASIVISMILSFQLVACSAWKMVPYTDTMGIPFAVMAIYFYMKYQKTKSNLLKALFIALTLMSGMVGGAIKASIYLVVIAVIGVEILELLKNGREKIKIFIFQMVFLMVLFLVQKTLIATWQKEIGLEFNPTVSVSWHHFFAMGLNEKTTGAYDEYYLSIVGQYQYDREGRIKADMELAKQSFKDRGFGGSVLFYARKLVMTYNDGLFGWTTEVWEDPYSKYQTTLADNNKFTDFLRNVYWNGPYVGRFNTISQLMWLISMVAFPGAVVSCFRKKEEDQRILVVTFLGIFFYQMLFEARARYLFVFLPVLVAMAVYGINMYLELIINLKTRKDK